MISRSSRNRQRIAKTLRRRTQSVNTVSQDGRRVDAVIKKVATCAKEGIPDV